MFASTVNIDRLIKEAIQENARRGAYDPHIPGVGSILDLSTVEYMEAFGQVQDNKTKRRVPFRAHTVNERMTLALLGYMDDPGYDIDGLPDWLLGVSGRQSTKSTVAASGLTVAAMRNPGTEAFILADTNERAKYLYQRARQLHRYLPDRVRTPLETKGSERRLNFAPDIGGTLDFFSAERSGGMVGYSGKVGQISEIPFMQDPAKALSVLLPAMYHQSDSRLILESTPAPPSYNGAEYWRNLVVGALSNNNRFKVLFSPFWESTLNRKTWNPNDALTNEELRLLEQFGPKGLTRQHLAFRRSVIDTDEEIRRNPALFDVWYPFSLASCWGGGNLGLFPDKVMARHIDAMCADRVNPAPFEPHRRVVIGADPAGLLGGADHASYTVIAADQTDWDLREVFSDSVTTHEFVDELIRVATYYHGRTGRWPDIAVESNGVGAATLALLIERKYPGLYYEASRRPGITASKQANNRMIAEACDALMDDLKPLFSLPLVMQLQTYTGDRQKRTTELSMLINGLAKGRRERQHWDLASAFMITVDALRNLPLPRSLKTPRPNVLQPKALTPAEYEKLRAQEAADRSKRTPRGRR